MNNNKLKKYFRTQKCWGFIIMMFGIIMACTLEPLVGSIFIMMGLYLMRTKEMVWTNDYFFEVQEENESE